MFCLDVVGVTSRLSNKQIFSYNETILFDYVSYDSGSHYSTQTGQFTCPKEGAYYLCVNLQRYKTHRFQAFIALYFFC